MQFKDIELILMPQERNFDKFEAHLFWIQTKPNEDSSYSHNPCIDSYSGSGLSYNTDNSDKYQWSNSVQSFVGARAWTLWNFKVKCIYETFAICLVLSR